MDLLLIITEVVSIVLDYGLLQGLIPILPPVSHNKDLSNHINNDVFLLTIFNMFDISVMLLNPHIFIIYTTLVISNNYFVPYSHIVNILSLI